MGMDGRTPVIVGVGQHTNRTNEGAEPLSPVEMMLEATAAADKDSGAAFAHRADAVATVPIVSWKYTDPGRLVAEALGNDRATTWYPAMGGNSPQMLLNRLCNSIAAGEMSVGLLCGGEAWLSTGRARRAGEDLGWPTQTKGKPGWGSEDKFSMGHPAELAHGIIKPVDTYPLFETALMHAAIEEHPGRAMDDQLRQVGEMWAGFSRVAAHNPYAWSRSELTAEQIITPTEDNRYVSWPYTKRMVSNPNVDMASALIVTSVEAAEAAGVARDRWVFPHSGTDGKDRIMSERNSFVRSPSVGVAGRRCLELSGVTLDDVSHLDVYSCFPSAVQLFCHEMGIEPLDRPLTVYGGLSFGGGPWNNPVGHALAAMVGVLRDDPGTLGLVTANGGNVDKHAFGLLGTDPPTSGWRHEVPQSEIDASVAGRTVLTDYTGPVTVEAYSVVHDRHRNRERLIASNLTPEGNRVWGVSKDADLMETAESSDLVGTSAHVGDEAFLTVAGSP
ncbi:MAG: acetyl-CoA acetyltransferase [Microthrixaceae bacterium]